MFGRCQLYRNDGGGKFTDVTLDVLGQTPWGGVGANLFDFNPEAKRAPKVFLDPESGQVVKSPPATGTPTPTPTPSSVSVTTAVGGTVEGATDPAPAAAVKTPSVTTSGTPAKLKLTCTTKRAAKSVSVSCAATGTDANSKGIAVRLRLVKGSSVVATTRTTLKRGKVKATLKSRRYTLRIAVTRKGGVIGISKSV